MLLSGCAKWPTETSHGPESESESESESEAETGIEGSFNFCWVLPGDFNQHCNYESKQQICVMQENRILNTLILLKLIFWCFIEYVTL